MIKCHWIFHKRFRKIIEKSPKYKYNKYKYKRFTIMGKESIKVRFRKIHYVCFSCLFVVQVFLLSACSFFFTPEPETTEAPLTSPYGDEIPAYSDVGRTDLNSELFLKDEKDRYYYNDDSVKTFTGVDVSVFQEEIDWEAVKNDGIDFAMLRVGYRGYGTEGLIGEDDLFYTNYENALAAGLDVGVYFFSQATTPEEAREEARFVLDRIKGLNITYPVAYDWEAIDYDDARTDNMTTEQISDCAVAFCQTVSESGYQVLVYFNRELGYFNYDLSKVNRYHFWLAEYVTTPTFIYDYKIWQYTKEGQVDGIDGNVDLSICVYDYVNAK